MALKVLFVNSDFGGCGYYRCMLPARIINEQGVAKTDFSILFNESHMYYYDLVVIQRSCNVEVLEAVKKFRKNNRPILYELDDDLFSVPASNPAHAYYSPQRRKVAAEIIGLCDGCIVTTKGLKQLLSQWNDNIYIIPNYLDKELWDSLPPREKGDELVVGWAGTATHIDDFKLCEETLLQFKGRVRFAFLGWLPPKFANIATFTPFANYNQYVASLSCLDVAVAPIVDNRFNQSKSWIKLLEYGGRGISCVASRAGSYVDAYELGAGVLLAKSPKEWLKGLKSLIDNDDARMQLSAKGQKWAANNWIQDHAQEWIKVFDEVMERGSYLSAQEQFGRVPKPKLIQSEKQLLSWKLTRK